MFPNSNKAHVMSCDWVFLADEIKSCFKWALQITEVLRAADRITGPGLSGFSLMPKSVKDTRLRKTFKTFTPNLDRQIARGDIASVFCCRVWCSAGTKRISRALSHRCFAIMCGARCLWYLPAELIILATALNNEARVILQDWGINSHKTSAFCWDTRLI